MNETEPLAEPQEQTIWTRIEAQVDALPGWARPAIYGPLILCYLILIRGGILLVPILGYFFITGGAAFLPTFLSGTGLFLLLLAASAVGGLAYGLIGRPLRRVPGGRYLAGMVAIAPYIAAVSVTLRVEDGRALLGAWNGEDWFIFSLMTLLFGVVIGHSWFAPEPSEHSPDDPDTIVPT